MHNAAVIRIGGQAGPCDHAKAFTLFTAAAERGLRDSQFNLAILHERGLGTTADKAEAYLLVPPRRPPGRRRRRGARRHAGQVTRRPPNAPASTRSLPPGRRSPATTAPMSWRSPIPPGRNRTPPCSLSSAAVPLSRRQPAADDLVAEAQQLLARARLQCRHARRQAGQPHRRRAPPVPAAVGPRGDGRGHARGAGRDARHRPADFRPLVLRRATGQIAAP